MLFAMAAANARAGPPTAATSTVDPCVRICPAADLIFHIVVRRFESPYPFATVVVDFAPCPAVILSPTSDSEPYVIDPPAYVRMTSSTQGVADLPIRAGGVCPGTLVDVYASGMLLARRPVASPDLNGDAVVSAADQALLAAKLGGPYDPAADLDCDGTLGAGDASTLNAHLGHAFGVVPVRPRSWGMIKTIYR